MKRFQPKVEDDIAAHLEIEAKENNRLPGPHAAHILTQHVKKQQAKHQAKREINKP